MVSPRFWPRRFFENACGEQIFLAGRRRRAFRRPPMVCRSGQSRPVPAKGARPIVEDASFGIAPAKKPYTKVCKASFSCTFPCNRL